MAKTVVHTKTVVQKKKSVCKKNVVPKKKVVHKKNKVVTEVAYEENEGDLSEIDDEAPAHQKLRGQTALVTAACPRKYLKCLAQRMAKNQRIPEDFSKDEFLTKFRRVFNANCNQSIQKATCHDEPHKRFNLSTKKRERHKHIALLASGTYAHKQVADAFFRECGIRISFSFKLKRFVGNLDYLMTPGKKTSTDLDTDPAKYPPTLDLQDELRAARHPGDAPAAAGKKRKRLTFDDVSNIILEGVGSGPLKSGRDLEAATCKLKYEGKVELWNYCGDLKTASDSAALVSKVWRLHGSQVHPLWHTEPEHKLTEFDYGDLNYVKQWLEGGYKTHALVLSGDGGTGKTCLAEALASQVSSTGFWFLDDPDDLRALEGLLQPGHAIIIDERDLAEVPVNEVKKLLDLAKTRRIRCRHFNGTLPAGCPRIFTTNAADLESFYPMMRNKQDRTGVLRRQMFQVVSKSVRKADAVTLPVAADRKPVKGDFDDEDGFMHEEEC